MWNIPFPSPFCFKNHVPPWKVKICNYFESVHIHQLLFISLTFFACFHEHVLILFLVGAKCYFKRFSPQSVCIVILTVELTITMVQQIKVDDKEFHHIFSTYLFVSIFQASVSRLWRSSGLYSHEIWCI